MNKSKEKNSVLHILKVIIHIAFSAAPFYLSVCLILGIVYGVSRALIILMTQNLLGDFRYAIEGKVDIETVFIALAGLLLVILINHISCGFYNGILEDISFRIMGKMANVLHEKASKLDPIIFEDPGNLDDIQKAKDGIMNSTFFFNILFGIFIYYIPYFIFMTVYLYSLYPVLSIAVILVFIPVALTQYIRVKIYSNAIDTTAPIKRKYLDYKKCLVDKEFFKETRILGANHYFKKLFTRAVQQYDRTLWDAEKKSNRIETMMKAITLLGYISVLLLFVITLLKGKITVEAFYAIFISIDTMFAIMDQLISNHIGRLSNDFASIKNYVKFIELPVIERNLNIDELGKIVLSDVSFKYPGSDNYIIKNINLEINEGETIAIVGENGAGKSNLIKLITGIYQPSEGSIKIGNNNMNDINRKNIYGKISAVFQNFQKYKLSLKDNIIISNFKRSKIDINEDKNENIKEILELVDFKNDNINQDYTTILSSEFNGIELSGGEWQKIAIARGLYKKHDMIVLDEPTASIDPNEEARIFKLFSKMAKDCTALIVTHRLSLVGFADRIIVIDKGEIIESGTHEELMGKNGVYAKMYNIQKQMYQF